MNFLSHYYFERNASPYQVFGAILPDLYKAGRRRGNIRPERFKEALKKDFDIAEIYQGWERHQIVDEVFHDSEFFTWGTEELKKRLKKIDFKEIKVRDYVLAHVLLELMLDRQLLVDNKADVDDFYEKLAKVDKEKVLQFITINEMTLPKEFFKFYDHFMEVQFVRRYMYNESIVYALSRVFGKLWDTDFEPYKEQLTEVIEDFVPVLAEKYNSIYDQIEEILSK